MALKLLVGQTVIEFLVKTCKVLFCLIPVTQELLDLINFNQTSLSFSYTFFQDAKIKVLVIFRYCTKRA